MSDDPHPRVLRRLWYRLFAALRICLPGDLRRRHGEAMLELFGRELDTRAAHGNVALSAAALMGIADLVGRGLHERFAEEQRAMGRDDLVVLRKAAAAFVIVFVELELAFLLLSSWARGLGGDRALEVMMFSVPFIAAMTLPMAMFIATVWSTRRARDETRRTAASEGAGRSAMTRLTPLIGLASLVALLALVVNTQLVPRANARLQAIQAGRVDVPLSDRSLTLHELRARSQQLGAEHADAPSRETLARVAGLEVEIQKKFALAAACVVLTLLAVGITRRAARANLFVLAIASAAVFTGYYVALIVGEQLADRLLVSPALAMWSGNLLALVVAAVTLRSSPRSDGVTPLTST
jgi:lipopolysaccharide export LptBFGC system permease protein LptF